mmetsp:Transcript_7522/g.10983  ORF Transcript_7522/g.10983 Transcript_7522/m.10983 type:complete len:406 (-) Transcript_7522:64-1281(-)
MVTFHINLTRCGDLARSKLGGGSLLFVDRADGKCGKSLHKSSSVIGSWGISKLEHGLGELSVELGVGVLKGRLDVNKLLEVIEGSVHLNDRNGLSVVLLRSRRQLDSWGWGGKLLSRRGPLDVGSLIEDVCGVEVRYSYLLDVTDLKGLLVLLVQVGGENLDDEVGMFLLGGDVGIEVGLTGLDGSKDGLKGVSTFLHITLDLPVKLDIVGDIKVKGEVEKVTYTFIVHGVKSLEDDDWGGLNGLGGVEGSVNVIVDGLGDGLSVLQCLDLLEHQVEVVLFSVQGGQSTLLTSITVVAVVIIEADNSGEVGNEGVGLPSIVGAESSSEGSYNISSEDVGETAHESGLSASRISGYTDNDGGLSIDKGHGKSGGRLNIGGELGRESRRGEGGRGGEEGADAKELHD